MRDPDSNLLYIINMPRRNHQFAVDEYYHCYNRGTDKRVVFCDQQDYQYFIKSAESYNSTLILGKLRLYDDNQSTERIVDIVSYCLLPNHYHFVLKERVEHGVSNFIHRLSLGYTMYFNNKYKRSGVLFQGPFKSKHIEDDQDLRQVIAYVNFNYKVHNISDPTLYRSWLNNHLEIIRDPDSIYVDEDKMQEIVDIIKLQRLSFD